MKKFLFYFVFFPILGFSQAPPTYYSGTESLVGYQLKTKLHDIISSKPITWNYSDLPIFYNDTDIDHHYDYDASNSIYLLDMYSNNPTGASAYHYTGSQLISTAGQEGLGYNREHIMPQSTFDSNYPMYSDLFFVIPTDARINQIRNNFPFGIGGAVNYTVFSNGSRMSNNATPNSGYTGRVYEPHAEFKGDIARSLLYFAVRYEGKLNSFKFDNGTSAANDRNPLDGTEEKSFEDWYVNMLLKWHNEDPVSPKEIERNNNVFAVQKNRNPFIDHPEWVDLIWNQTASSSVPLAPLNLSSTQISSYFINLNWNDSPSSDLLGYKVYQNGLYIGYTTNTSFTVDHLLPSTNYQFSIRAYNDSYMESADSNFFSVATLSSDRYTRDLMISKYLEGTDDNKALEITNKTGHAVSLNGYKISAQFYNTVNGNYYFPAPYDLEGVINNNETIVILHPRANFSCITNNDAAFLSASPQISFSGSNYLELRYRSTTIDAIGSKYIDNTSLLANVSLYRIPAITEPNNSFTLSEWDTHAVDYCDNIGVLSAANVPNPVDNEISIYPNPVADAKLFVSGQNLSRFENAQIFSMTGQLIMTVEKPFNKSNIVEVHDLPAGIFLLKLGEVTLQFIKK
ncbi:T9SS type A sorting domain-containing protein [Chryseobacterium sp. SNU WT5]|uniref:endonuclease n=1 Tax=Chryseobacterium sp. SNU WT5 TaxID=2594269 RepID=UPI00117EB6E1|nr:endonuclease [Chryseobacterium sp. SNU WT5]QDP86414.1 T9SS type A sorting domain-containing protein [Chryseobacterium sp. SNU WT5]